MANKRNTESGAAVDRAATGSASSSTPTLIKALRVLAVEIQSGEGVANAAILEASQRLEEMLSLLDGAYDVVEIWKAETPHQTQWKSEWLKIARKCGAIPL